LINSKNISTREEIVTSYDYTVQGGSIIQPIQGLGKICVEAGVSKPLLDEKCGVAISSAMNPSYGGHDEDTYNMSAYAIDTAIRNVVVVGANPEKIALLDNFCWSNSFDPKRLWQLRRATLACYETAIAFCTPYISGKDSMFNDFKGFDKENNPIKMSDLPTLLISSLGIVDDTSVCVTSEFKDQGDLIYIIGETKSELGGSEYFRMLGYKGGFVPQVDCVQSLKNYQSFYELLKKRLIQSSISVHDGGLITAINKSIIGSLSGAKLDFQSLDKCKTVEQFLFSESSGRIVFSIKEKNKLTVENFLKEKDVSFNLLGEVTEKSSNISLKVLNKQIIYSLEDLCRAYYRKILS
jgi:phosphoribosylformylglycinamidine synthase